MIYFVYDIFYVNVKYPFTCVLHISRCSYKNLVKYKILTQFPVKLLYIRVFNKTCYQIKIRAEVATKCT